jgi:hypothetical protein
MENWLNGAMTLVPARMAEPKLHGAVQAHMAQLSAACVIMLPLSLDTHSCHVAVTWLTHSQVHSSMFRPLESCAPSLLHLDLSYTLPTPGVCTALRTLPYLEVLELAYAKLTWQASKMVRPITSQPKAAGG